MAGFEFAKEFSVSYRKGAQERARLPSTTIHYVCIDSVAGYIANTST